MPMNNEVDIITVGGVDQDIRDTYTRRSISLTEPLAVASKAYRPHELFFSGIDRLLYEAITDISIGDTFTPDVNVRQRPISDMMYELFAQSPDYVLNDVIGNYERTANASRTYHDGEKIVWSDGQYYRVVGTVNQGTAWVVDSNIIASDGISGLIKNLEDTKDGKVVLTQNLTAGETTVTFTDSSIGNNSLLEVYTDIYGANPRTMTQSGTTVTVTFKAQASSMTVKLIVREE